MTILVILPHYFNHGTGTYRVPYLQRLPGTPFSIPSTAPEKGYEGTGRGSEVNATNQRSGLVLTRPSLSAYSSTPNHWLSHLRGLREWRTEIYVVNPRDLSEWRIWKLRIPIRSRPATQPFPW